YETCIACHSAAAAPPGMVVPVLEGQPDQFLQWQLVYFRSETRKDLVMTPIAETLTDVDIRNIGAYLASLQAPAIPATKDAQPELTAAGERLAKTNRCEICHQAGYSGRDAVARIGGQREAYLLKALRDFKSGARRGGGVAAMPDAVYPLHDADLQALAHFLSRVRSAP
ncbi:MAG: c-type cytochrome, partial [Casimicrobiaceae bacterium]